MPILTQWRTVTCYPETGTYKHVTFVKSILRCSTKESLHYRDSTFYNQLIAAVGWPKHRRGEAAIDAAPDSTSEAGPEARPMLVIDYWQLLTYVLNVFVRDIQSFQKLSLPHGCPEGNRNEPIYQQNSLHKIFGLLYFYLLLLLALTCQIQQLNKLRRPSQRYFLRLSLTSVILLMQTKIIITLLLIPTVLLICCSYFFPEYH